MYLSRTRFNCLSLLFTALFVAVAVTGCSTYNINTTKALSKAKQNKSKLRKVLNHYKTAGDEEKLAAAEYLISNMPGHGYIVAAFYDKDGKEVPFEATDYENYDAANEVLKKLEAEHGDLEYKRKEFVPDIETITADYLIENIDLSFDTWKNNPWAQGMTFEAFCENILPYRCSNEPINRWRKACMDRYKNIREQMQNPDDIKEAAKLIEKDVHQWVKFDTLYYLHPTDQGFDEMNISGFGRCEDISNMISYAMRANGIAVASDYTPAWANRDNNHAWNAILDSEGKGSAPLANIAAKVYRKTFATQIDAIVFAKKKGEQIPKWLAGKTFVDVTDQYFKTFDAAVRLAEDRPGNVSFAYLCVFNGGEWTPIAAGRINSKEVVFERMGTGIVYLPAYYYDDEIHPVAAPLILHKDGSIEILNGSDNAGTVRVEVTTLKPATGDDDTHIDIPHIIVEPDKTYEMFYWDNGWQSLGNKTTSAESVFFDNLPAGRLYWMVEEKSDRLERIFTVENNRQNWW